MRSAQEPLTNVHYKKFRSGDESLDNNQLRSFVESNPSKTILGLAEELHVATGTITIHFGVSKNLDRRVSHELNANQKISVLNYLLFFFYAVRTTRFPIVFSTTTDNNFALSSHFFKHFDSFL